MEWTPTPTLLLLVLALVVAIGAVRRVYLSPLSRFPGPPSAALTLWNEFYWDVVKRGTFIWRIQDMHERYGPIVRINPYEIHVNDPDFFEDLYVSNRRLDKYRWWTNTAGADGSSFSTVPHDLHRRRRAALNPFFSARAVTQLEPLLRAKVEKLSSRFVSIAASGEVVRLDAAFMALTMDIICDYAFARDRRYLDEPDFMLLWKKTLLGAFENGATSRQFPWLLPLMKSLPLSVVSALHPGVGHLFWWQRSVKEQIRPILDGTPATEKEGGARTIFHTLRDSDLPDEEKTLDRFCDEGEILTGAGSETTAQATTRLMFYLKHEPGTLVRLREELDAAVPNAAEIPSWMELQKLPYLSAAIKEATRMSGGVTTRLPRVCHEDIRYKDYIIPAGTPVSMTTYLVLMNPSVFPDPHRFRPERWLEAAAEGRNLDKYFVPFGKGTRQCPGMNLAHAEMFLAATMMVRRFDWDMYETGLGDVVCKHDHFVAVGDLDSKGVRATLRLRN